MRLRSTKPTNDPGTKRQLTFQYGRVEGRLPVCVCAPKIHWERRAGRTNEWEGSFVRMKCFTHSSSIGYGCAALPTIQILFCEEIWSAAALLVHYQHPKSSPSANDESSKVIIINYHDNVGCLLGYGEFPPESPTSHRRRTLSQCANYYQLMRARLLQSVHPYMQTKSIDESTRKSEKNLAADPLKYIWRFSFMNEQNYMNCSRPMDAGRQTTNP